jgi:putative FmdB family regulatory protein
MRGATQDDQPITVGLGNGFLEVTADISVGGQTMPVYEYACDTCKRKVTVMMSISEHEKGRAACPQCGGKTLRPLTSSFLSQTSRKS